MRESENFWCYQKISDCNGFSDSVSDDYFTLNTYTIWRHVKIVYILKFAHTAVYSGARRWRNVPKELWKFEPTEFVSSKHQKFMWYGTRTHFYSSMKSADAKQKDSNRFAIPTSSIYWNLSSSLIFLSWKKVKCKLNYRDKLQGSKVIILSKMKG